MLRSLPALLLALGCTHSPDRGSSAERACSTHAPAILFPSPGDTLVEGRTHTIRRGAAPGRPINLGAVMGGHDKGQLLTNASSGIDSLIWTVPIGFVTGFGVPSSDQMRLRLEYADSLDQWVETGPFIIIGARKP